MSEKKNHDFLLLILWIPVMFRKNVNRIYKIIEDYAMVPYLLAVQGKKVTATFTVT